MSRVDPEDSFGFGAGASTIDATQVENGQVGSETSVSWPNPFPVYQGKGFMVCLGKDGDPVYKDFGTGTREYGLLFFDFELNSEDPSIFRAKYRVTETMCPDDAAAEVKAQIGCYYTEQRYYRVDRVKKVFQMVGGIDLPDEGTMPSEDSWSVDSKNKIPNEGMSCVTVGGWSYFHDKEFQPEYEMNEDNTVFCGCNFMTSDGTINIHATDNLTFFLSMGPGYRVDLKDEVCVNLRPPKDEPIHARLAELKTYFLDSKYRAVTEDAPLNVQVELDVKSISRVDTMADQFALDAQIVLIWPITKRDAVSYVASHNRESWMPKDASVPELTLVNAAALDANTSPAVASAGRVNVLKLDDGAVVAKQTIRVTGELHEVFELHNYPFDSQPLKVILSADLGESSIHFTPKSQPDVLTDDVLFSTEWSGRNLPKLVCEEKIRNDGNLKNREVMISIQFLVSREYKVMLYRIVAIMSLFSLLTMSIFSMDPIDYAGDRLAVAVSLLLTATAYSLVVASSLPVLGYLTWLDSYILGTFFYMAVVMIQVSVLNWCDESWGSEIVDSGNETRNADVCLYINDMMLYVDAGVWTAVHLMLSIQVFCFVIPRESTRTDL